MSAFLIGHVNDIGSGAKVKGERPLSTSPSLSAAD
jgi:hypothetical protein